MNRYDGNTGRVERVPERGPDMYQPPADYFDGGIEENIRPSGQSGNLGGLGGILGGQGGGLGSVLGGHGGGLGSILGGLGGGHGGILGGHGGGLGSILGGQGGGLGSILGGHGSEQGGILGSIISKISKPNLELEDLILVAVLYLLYRESGDTEFLLIAGAMLFL